MQSAETYGEIFESIPCAGIPGSGYGVDLVSKSHQYTWNLNSGPPCLGYESCFFRGKPQKLLIPLPVERKVSEFLLMVEGSNTKSKPLWLQFYTSLILIPLVNLRALSNLLVSDSPLMCTVLYAIYIAV